MTVRIDAGIGNITMSCLDNLKLEMLLESLKEKIESGGLDALVKFLDT